MLRPSPNHGTQRLPNDNDDDDDDDDERLYLVQTQYFLITETQMAIQTEVTLQPDYTCCLRVMGKKSRIAEIVILSPCQCTRWSLSSTIVNTTCVNFLSAMWRH